MNTAERPRSPLHTHTAESCDFATLPKQSVGALGTRHVVFAFEDLVSFDTCAVLANEILETKPERTSQSALCLIQALTTQRLSDSIFLSWGFKDRPSVEISHTVQSRTSKRMR